MTCAQPDRSLTMSLWRLIHDLRRFKRKLFKGKTPDWARDAYGLLKFVNFFELLPTLMCLALAPEHLFRRLPQIAQGKTTIHKTPLKFLTSCISLAVALFSWTISRAEGQAIRVSSLLFAILALLSPFWVAGLSLIQLLMSRLIRGSTVGQILEMNFDLNLDTQLYSVPLRYSTYRRLDGSVYLRGAAYFAMYFWAMHAFAILVLLIAAVPGGLAIYGLQAVFGNSENRLVSQFVFAVLTITVLPAGWLIHRFVLVPYLELLNSSVRYPTLSMQIAEANRLRGLLRGRRSLILKVTVIVRRWKILRISFFEQEMRSCQESGTALRNYLAQRAKAYADFTLDLKIASHNFTPGSTMRATIDHVIQELDLIDSHKPLSLLQPLSMAAHE